MAIFSDKDCYSVTQSQLILALQNTIMLSFNDELENVKADQNKLPSFTDSQCRKMKLPQLKYEVQNRGLMVVGTGTGGASKKIDYINALLGRQASRKVVRSII